MKGELIYEGKAKKVYSMEGDNTLVCIEYKDSLTAFNAKKTGSFSNKGKINKEISVIIYKYLERSGIPTHYISTPDDITIIAHRVKVIPLEVVVRNKVAGSLAKKFSFQEGLSLKQPLIEFYYKNDVLGDPFINDDHVFMFELLTKKEIEAIRLTTQKINDLLKKLFDKVDIELIDFKIEFGKNNSGHIILADEISPDCCRLWDKKTKEKMDKDRFRQDLGKVDEMYQEVLNRLKKVEV